MQSLFEKLKRQFRYLYRKVHPLVVRAIEFTQHQYGQLIEYYRTHPKARRWTIFGSIVVVPTLLFLLLIWMELPGKKELRNIRNHVASEVYSADSVLLGRYYIQDRTEVQFDDISPVVIDALLATEDVRYYEHEGVDFVSLGRVLVKSIFMQEESAGGGSTLSQQLSKNLYPRKKYWLLSMPRNKIREAITAMRLEDIYPKKELLTLYLNTVPFADQTYGIEAAAKRFFSSSAKNLTAEQAAVLIGMLKATHTYNPRLFPDRAKERRNVVLAQMAKYGFLTEEESKTFQEKELKLQYNKVSHHQGLAPYFREYLKAELAEWCKENKKPDGTEYNLYTDGLKIYTTLDAKLQTYAEKAVAQQMSEVQKQFYNHWGKQRPWDDNKQIISDALRRTTRYQKLKEQGYSEKGILDSLQKPVPMRIFTWQGEKDVKMSPLDSIKHHIQFLNAGFLAMEPKTGRVLAWVGGIEHDFFQYDHVKLSTKRQVGSIFKPLVYATAIEKGISPCELIPAGQQTYIDEEGEKWTPRNMQNDYEVKYTMRGALAYSVNTVAVKLIQRAGVESTLRLAGKMGISSEMPKVPSVALGSSSLSLMEMTAAYACLANDGIASLPYYITSIKDQYGNVFKDFKPKGSGKRALSAETAQIVKQMMQTVVHEGTASRLRWKYGIYNDVAAKTGTTQANADGWFMAITPAMVVGTWVGADDPRIHFRSTELGQGSNTALPMFAYFMKHINNDRAFKRISEAKFKPLPYATQQRLACDLYELDAPLWDKIMRTVAEQDSIMAADSLSPPRTETFLEKLLKRKQKIIRANEPKDSLQLDLDDLQFELTLEE